MRVVLVSVESGEQDLRTAFRRPGGELGDDLAAAGHEVRELSLFLRDGDRRSSGSRLRTASPSSAALGLARALDAGGYDLVHALGERAGRLVERAALSRPWVWSYDEADAGSSERGWCPRSASMLVAPTSGVADALARAGAARSRIHVVPERLATTVVRGPLDGVRQRASLLMTVLDDRGGTADVVRALSRLPATRLTVLTGPGPDEERRGRLRLLARQLHVEDRLQFLALSDRGDALRAIETADAFVHVPHTRMWLAPVVAAMSVATPVVVTDLPEADGIVTNGCTGLRVPVADPHRLALRLSILSADPQMRDDVAVTARRFVRDEVSVEGTLASVLDCYAKVASLRESA